MAFNALNAAQMLDNEVLSEDEINFLLRARQGMLVRDLGTADSDGDGESDDEKIFKDMRMLGLVQQIPFSHPRVLSSYPGIALTDDGTTVVNVIDKRLREYGTGYVAPWDTAGTSVPEEVARTATLETRNQTVETPEDREQLKKNIEKSEEQQRKAAKARAEAMNESDEDAAPVKDLRKAGANNPAKPKNDSKSDKKND